MIILPSVNFQSSANSEVFPCAPGAGGMAGHVRFSARTGGSRVILGAVLLIVAVFFSRSMATFLRLFPSSIVGVILFLTGAQLALGSCEISKDKGERFATMITAALAVCMLGSRPSLACAPMRSPTSIIRAISIAAEHRPEGWNAWLTFDQRAGVSWLGRAGLKYLRKLTGVPHRRTRRGRARSCRGRRAPRFPTFGLRRRCWLVSADHIDQA